MNSTFPDIVWDYLVSEKLYSYIDLSVNVWTMLFLSCFGVVTNVLNAVVFVRQGFRDSINISMMAITSWDLIKCSSGLIHRVYGPLQAVSLWLSHCWRIFTYYAEYTSLFSGAVSYSLTAYVSVERCLCVSMPLKVRSYITAHFTLFMVMVISAVTFGAFVVVYFIYDIHYVYYPKFNAITPNVYYTAFYYRTQDVTLPYYIYITIILPFLSFTVLCVCSSITVFYLKKSSQFVGKSSSASGISLRERRASSMLLAIIIVKIGNLFPRMVTYIAQLVEPEFYSLRHYHYLFVSVTRFIFLLDFVNAIVNFFIYFRMSSNFRTTFYLLFTRSPNNG